MKAHGSLWVVCIVVLSALSIPEARAMDRSAQRELLWRMFHYTDYVIQHPDSVCSSTYFKQQFNVVKRNALLMAVPTLYHFSYGEDRKYLSESFSSLTFFGGQPVNSTRHLQISTIKRYRKTMPNLVPYLTPNIYNETLVGDRILSPFHRHNRIFYKYKVQDMGTRWVIVQFRPRSFNTQTVRGHAWVDFESGRVLSAHLEGEYDMINFAIDVEMSDGDYPFIPKQCTLNARFSLLGNRLTACHQAFYNVPITMSEALVDNHDPSLMAMVRQDSLTDEQREIYAVKEERDRKREEERAKAKEQEKEQPRKSNFVKEVLWDIIGDNVLNRIKGHFGKDKRGSFRTSPLFNPLYLEYSKRRGVTYRFDIRGIYDLDDNRELYARLKLGYAFKQRQFYWNLPMEYTFDKSRNGLVRLEFGAGDRISNGLVAQHILDLEHITEWTGSERIDEFKDSYTKAHVQYNFSDYFGMKVGMVFHRRSAVAKGVYRQRGLLTDYRSFSPLLELQYRPLGMNGPVITADYERGIKGVFKSDNNYERWEFDLSYIHPMPCMRYLSMRAGGGFYSTAIDTYNFVDYSNFRENNIPGGWNDDWSGDFELLSRKWYNTSKYYLRANVTYESPLLAISWIPFIGHFIEKERVYLGLLKTENLKHYEEIGYGFTNRIFSIVAFMALRDGRYDGFGMKFGFELFSNW